MQSLIERLFHNNVIFSYYGFVDASVLAEVLRITKSKLENHNESVHITDRVLNAINDCVENIIEHNFFPEDAVLAYKCLILVSRDDQSYHINTINVINGQQKESIHEQMKDLQRKDKKELNELISHIKIKNSQATVAEDKGLGLANLVLGSDKCVYEFRDYKSDFLFNINFEIKSLN